jgi:hypothetical protein
MGKVETKALLCRTDHHLRLPVGMDRCGKCHYAGRGYGDEVELVSRADVAERIEALADEIDANGGDMPLDVYTASIRALAEQIRKEGE